MNKTRRQLLTGISLIGAGAILSGCKNPQSSSGTGSTSRSDASPEDAPGVDVTAVESLMRDHGILRRNLVVYREYATKLRQDPTSAPPDVLEKAAKLFRVFGEDFHETKLEETYIFPALKKAQSPAAVYIEVLLAQHARGREITDFLLEVSKADKIPSGSINAVATAMETFARMYEHHSAIEDTIIFPAWKAGVGDRSLEELAAKFDEIASEDFGGDGFEAAAARIAEIEQDLGLANLGVFTAPSVSR